jgi:hypothetical protein
MGWDGRDAIRQDEMTWDRMGWKGWDQTGWDWMRWDLLLNKALFECNAPSARCCNVLIMLHLRLLDPTFYLG